MPPALRVLVVDDHPLFADAVSASLAKLARHVTVRVSSSAEAALEEIRSSKAFDLVLLDLALPGLAGQAAFDAIHAAAPAVPVVIVSASEPSGRVHAMLKGGARGFVQKRATAGELVAILRFVLAGGTHVPPEILGLRSASADGIVLTPRQREVLALLAAGRSNREIADALGISEGTVRVHVSSVMRVLDVENRTQAATSDYARRLLDETF